MDLKDMKSFMASLLLRYLSICARLSREQNIYLSEGPDLSSIECMRSIRYIALFSSALLLLSLLSPSSIGLIRRLMDESGASRLVNQAWPNLLL